MYNSIPLEANNVIKKIVNSSARQRRKNQHELYKKYYSFAMQNIYPKVQDEKVAIQIVNDGFFKVFNRLSRFNPKQHVFTDWFRAILEDCYMSYTKKRKFQIKSISSLKRIRKHGVFNQSKTSIPFPNGTH